MRGGRLSYRRKRWLVALGALCLVAGGVAAAIVFLPRGMKADRSASPQPVVRQATSAAPRQVRLSASEQHRMLSEISLFISSSVARHHPERSWSIVHPSMREGMTKQQWSLGAIPVVPFPAAGVDLVQFQSVTSEDALVEVILVPTKGSHLVRKTFQIELRRLHQAPHDWAVSSWVPEGVSQTQMDANRPQDPAVVAAAAHPTHLSDTWIFVPIGVLIGGLILVPAFMFTREAFAGRRAEAKFRASLGPDELRR